MNLARAFERRDAFIECVANPLEIAYSREVNHGSEAIVGNGEDRGVVASDREEDRVESQEIDRLAADLHEISAAPKHAQPSPLHLPKIFGDQPAVDLRVDETIFCAVAAEERSSAKREAAIVFASRFEMIEQFFFDAH